MELRPSHAEGVISYLKSDAYGKDLLHDELQIFFLSNIASFLKKKYFAFLVSKAG